MTLFGAIFWRHQHGDEELSINVSATANSNNKCGILQGILILCILASPKLKHTATSATSVYFNKYLNICTHKILRYFNLHAPQKTFLFSNWLTEHNAAVKFFINHMLILECRGNTYILLHMNIQIG